MSSGVTFVDRTALKFNQASIVTIVLVAFAFQLQWLVAALAVVLLLGTIVPPAGAFKLLYAHVVRPLRILRPEVIEEDNRQHLFAQGLGGVFLVAAYLFLNVAGQFVIGWSLSLLVGALAFVNLTVNFCLGCFLYLRLRRWSFFTRAFLKRVTTI